jgi:hypothetical protein
VIGLLGTSTYDDYRPMIDLFRKGLGEAGYFEGKNVKFEHAWAGHDYDLLPTLANALADHRLNLILAASTPAALPRSRRLQLSPSSLQSSKPLSCMVATTPALGCLIKPARRVCRLRWRCRSTRGQRRAGPGRSSGP